ncbi:MAG: hypothetical protein O2794_03875 [bacterium]|nr:hypothetical protein [bacterium]
MKKVTCKAVQGPAECSHTFEVKDFDDFMTQAHEHFGSHHADMIKDVDEEGKKKWQEMAKGVVEATPEE